MFPRHPTLPNTCFMALFGYNVAEAVYIGFHSNGLSGTSTSTGRGAAADRQHVAPTPHQAGTNGLADMLGDQINQDFQNLNGVFEYNWTTSTTSTATNIISARSTWQLGRDGRHDHRSRVPRQFARQRCCCKTRRSAIRSPARFYQGTVQYFSLYGTPIWRATQACRHRLTTCAWSATPAAR